jgi:SAM-dependent methyltransferase
MCYIYGAAANQGGEAMNSGHAKLCSSAEWAEHIAGVVLPEALAELTLGDDVLEIGPGYGATTSRLWLTVPKLTVVEIDPNLATGLAERFPAVDVIQGDGAALPLPSGRFSAVVCFTMLHHVASKQAQGWIFAEARRVLRTGGVFAGSDSLASPDLAAFHDEDTYVPVDPRTLPRRLRRAGFDTCDVRVTAPGERFTFVARKHRPADRSHPRRSTT